MILLQNLPEQSNGNKMESINSLIIGAGPTGLTLGICLLSQGHKVIIAEKHQVGLDFSRAILVNSDTIESLEQYGTSAKIRKAGIAVDGLSINVNNRLISRAILDLSDINQSHPICLPQIETEKCLAETFAEMGGKIIRDFQFEASEIKNLGKKLNINLKSHSDSKKSIEVECEWLFGCDGYHSAVRQYLKIPFIGKNLEAKGYSVDAELENWPFKTSFNIWIEVGGVCAAFQMGEKSVRLIGTSKKIQQKILAKLPVKNISWDTSFDMSCEAVESYGRDNIWLAGDAAHVHTPLGGRGMNMGIADAISLAAAIKNNNPKEYEIARKDLSHKWVKNNYRASRLFMGQGLISNFSRYSIIILLTILGKIFGAKLALFLFEKISTAKVRLKK